MGAPQPDDPGGVGSIATLAEESAAPIITPAHYQSRLRENQVIAGEGREEISYFSNLANLGTPSPTARSSASVKDMRSVLRPVPSA